MCVKRDYCILNTVGNETVVAGVKHARAYQQCFEGLLLCETGRIFLVVYKKKRQVYVPSTSNAFMRNNLIRRLIEDQSEIIEAKFE